jgi:hypothetical protein
MNEAEHLQLLKLAAKALDYDVWGVWRDMDDNLLGLTIRWSKDTKSYFQWAPLRDGSDALHIVGSLRLDISFDRGQTEVVEVANQYEKEEDAVRAWVPVDNSDVQSAIRLAILKVAAKIGAKMVDTHLG